MLAFIGSTELIVAAVVGLLLFGGRLPEVLRQVGRAWVTLRRALNELKRETGLDEALREIRRDADVGSMADWRASMDHSAGPARKEGADEAQVESPPKPTEVDEAGAAPEGDAPDSDPDGPVPRRRSHPPEEGWE